MDGGGGEGASRKTSEWWRGWRLNNATQNYISNKKIEGITYKSHPSSILLLSNNADSFPSGGIVTHRYQQTCSVVAKYPARAKRDVNKVCYIVEGLNIKKAQYFT